MYEALQTVAACHQARIYHGDIKPANFMLANPLPEHSIQGELEKCAAALSRPCQPAVAASVPASMNASWSYLNGELSCAKAAGPRPNIIATC